MSYILDALRRAESERERERSAVPTLHAQTVGAHLNQQDDEEASSAGLARWRLVAAAVLALGALALLGFGLRSWLSAPPPQPAPAPVVADSNVAPAVPAIAPAVASSVPADSVPEPSPQIAPQPSPAAMPTVATSVPPPAAALPQPVRNLPAAAAPVQAPVLAQPTVSPPVAAAPSQTKPQPVNAKPAPSGSPALSPTIAPAQMPAANAAPPALASLPESLRRELPPLVAGGAMYSDTPANRMLIINGQVLHEGDKVTPDVTLEQIKLKGAVLSYKGQRFSINF